jgi:prevent-host-death family protein
MKQVNLYQARTHISALVEQAAGGEEIIIARKGRPRARLVPLTPEDMRRLADKRPYRDAPKV